MNHRDERRLTDILDAITAIESHLSRGELCDGLIFDGVRIRLLETGEAVKAVPAEITDRWLGGRSRCACDSNTAAIIAE